MMARSLSPPSMKKAFVHIEEIGSEFHTFVKSTTSLEKPKSQQQFQRPKGPLQT